MLLFVVFFGYQWLLVAIFWLLVAISGQAISGYQWLLVAISGYQWLLGQHYEFHQILIFMNFGRTDLRKAVSGAKFDGQADFEVRLAVAPQNPD